MPQCPVPPSGSLSASALQSNAGVAGTRQHLPFSSDSLGVGAVLPVGMGTLECAACSCSSPLSAGGPLGSTVTARPAAPAGWCTGQPVPGLC